MTSVKIKANGVSLTVSVDGKITTGMVGIPVLVELDSAWENLIIKVLFRVGERVRVMADNTVPWELLRTSGDLLEVGCEGRNEDGTLIIPTVWNTVSRIAEGASGQIPAAPTPGTSTNGSGSSAPTSAVLYTAQSLTDAQKAQARANIGAAAVGGGSGGGLTSTEKTLILSLFRNAAYTSADMGNVLTQLESLWSGGEVEPDEPEKTLTSISATYSGGDVTAGTDVSALTGIVVMAHYSDGTSEAVTGYTLSGTIAEGNNTITVSYGGKTTTFTVTGTAESGGDEPTAFGVSEISPNSVKYKGAIISNTSGDEFNKGFKYSGKIVSINVEAGKTYMLMGLHSNLTTTMIRTLSIGQSPVGDEPMAIDINADGTLGEVNTAFNPAYVWLPNVELKSGKIAFWSGEYDAWNQKKFISFVESVDGTDYAWCVCIFTANIDFCGIVQWNGPSLVDNNYFRIYEVDPNTEYNPYLDGVIGIGEER